jgi:hypothetical protein
VSAPQKSIVDEILDVLEVAKGGPVKLGGGTSTQKKVMLKDIEVDADKGTAQAIVAITGWSMDSRGCTHKVDREFTLTPDEAARLAKEAGDHRLSFSVAASTMRSQLAKEQQRRKEALDTWCRDGAPTQEDTKAMKPLRFKPSGN